MLHRDGGAKRVLFFYYFSLLKVGKGICEDALFLFSGQNPSPISTSRRIFFKIYRFGTSFLFKISPKMGHFFAPTPKGSNFPKLCFLKMWKKSVTV